MYVQPSDAFTTSIFSGVPTGVWQTIDISATVGASARMCQIKVTGVRSVGFRPLGNTNDYEVGLAETRGTANVTPELAIPGRAWVSTDTSGRFQMQSSNLDPVTLHLAGFHDSTPETTNDSLGTLDVIGPAWGDVDPRGVGAERALCLLSHKNDLATKVVSFRPSDETNDFILGTNVALGGPAVHTGNVAGIDYFGSLVPTGPDGIVGALATIGGGSTNITTYTHGYDTDYVESWQELFTDGDTPPAVFTTLDCKVDTAGTPTGVTGKALVYLRLFRVAAGALEEYAVRESDDAENYLPTVTGKPSGSVAVQIIGTRGKYVVVETNTDGEIEWITTNATEMIAVHLVGYVPGAVHTVAANTASYQFTSWPARQR